MKRPLRHLLAPGMIAFGLLIAPGQASLAQSSVVTVPPPQVLDYWVSVSRQPGGVLVFDGYAPSAAVRDALAERQGADVSWLKLGSGAPQGYDAALNFGLAALARLSEGRFALRGSVLSISGVAASQADFIALRDPQSLDVPAGLILAKAEIVAPPVEPYAFSLKRQANGNVLLSGYVPGPEVERSLLLVLGARSSSTLRFGSGEPLNFVTQLETALPLFALLQEGEIRFENGAWLLSGVPATGVAADQIRKAFEGDRLGESGWGLALAQPTPAAPAEPYRWAVEKSRTGAITMTGSVPTEALQRILGMRLGAGLDDRSDIDPAAPQGFITEALVVVDALAKLAQGSVTFDGSAWSITGQGATPAASGEIALALAATGTAWSVSVSDPAVIAAAAPEAQPAVTSETPSTETPAVVENSGPDVTAVPLSTTSTTSVEVPAPAITATDDIALCRTRLAELSAQNAILFRSGAAVLAEGGEAVLMAVADAVNHCPSVAIDVAGHTDSDGEAEANLVLSVARAEAVVNALVALGVAPERLYAIGYGESAPVADNATPAGKAQNRRIVVSVRDGA